MSLTKTRRGKWILLTALLVLAMTVLSGCAPQADQMRTIDDLKNGGFWQSNVVLYFTLALDTFAKWFNGEYGLAVLVMVLIVRTLILPLTMKQVRSSRAMQAIQPEIAKIREKYKEDPQKVQMETMKLFQEHKVNPMAGCLPLLVQMPIFIALYQSIYFNGPLREHEFLWLQLGEPDKLFILPVLAAFTTYFQTRMMIKMNPSPQQGMMQFMMFVYPVLIFVMSFQFPAALPLYWFFSNLYTIVQNYFLYRNNDKNAVVANVKTAGADNGQSKGPKNGKKGKKGAKKSR